MHGERSTSTHFKEDLKQPVWDPTLSEPWPTFLLPGMKRRSIGFYRSAALVRLPFCNECIHTLYYINGYAVMKIQAGLPLEFHHELPLAGQCQIEG